MPGLRSKKLRTASGFRLISRLTSAWGRAGLLTALLITELANAVLLNVAKLTVAKQSEIAIKGLIVIEGRFLMLYNCYEAIVAD